MTTSALTDTTTVRDLLFGGRADDVADALTSHLRASGTVRSRVHGMPTATGAAEEAVAGSVNRLLDMDLIDVAVAGWRRRRDLIDAARRTVNSPTSEETVPLVTHVVTSTQHPAVEVIVNGVSFGDIKLELDLSFAFKGVLAVIVLGKLTAIRAGHCIAAGNLTVAGFSAGRGQRKYEITKTVRLPVPVTIVTSAGAPCPAADDTQLAPAGWRATALGVPADVV